MSFEYNLHIVTENSEFLATWKEEIIYGKKFYGKNFNPYLQKICSVKFLRLVNLKTWWSKTYNFFAFEVVYFRVTFSGTFKRFQNVFYQMSNCLFIGVAFGTMWNTIKSQKFLPLKLKFLRGWIATLNTE